MGKEYSCDYCGDEFDFNDLEEGEFIITDEGGRLCKSCAEDGDEL